MGNGIRVFGGSLLFASALAVFACGGGGGGDGSPASPDALLAGSYVYLYLDRDVGGNGVFSEVSTFTSDGDGAIVFDQGWQTGEGGPGVYVRRANTAYDVAADRGLTLVGGFPSQLSGRVSSGGTYAAATAQGVGVDPGWLCAVRRDTSPTIAEIAGSWHVVSWQRSGAPPDVAQSMIAEATLDALGNITFSDVHYNLDGAIDPGGMAFVDSNFELGGPGGLRVVSWGATWFEGGMSSNGDVILLGARNAGNAAVWVFVRQGSSTGAGAALGSWTVTGYAAARPGYMCQSGTATFDGIGDGTWSSSANIDGAPGIGAAAPIEYGVGVDGQTSVLWPGSTAILGAAAPGFILFGGPLTPTRGPCLYTLIK